MCVCVLGGEGRGGGRVGAVSSTNYAGSCMRQTSCTLSMMFVHATIPLRLICLHLVQLLLLLLLYLLLLSVSPPQGQG